VIEFSDFFAFAMGCIVALVGLSVYNNRNSQLFNKKGKRRIGNIQSEIAGVSLIATLVHN